MIVAYIKNDSLLQVIDQSAKRPFGTNLHYVGKVMNSTNASTTECVSRLESSLQNRLSGRVWNLRLEMRDQGLVLQGQARTYYAKQLAQHRLMAETTLPVVANEIVVC